MDIDLARTFLAVVATGSFQGAAGQLHITQTAVSARIRALETQLGHRLFVRNKAGARLTPAGERFTRHAGILIQVWEGARHQIGLPADRQGLIAVGGAFSLWEPLFARWLTWMTANNPTFALKIEAGTPDQLMARVRGGTLDAAVLYGPAREPDLVTELLADEKLVMVTTRADGGAPPDQHIHVDWGVEFTASQQSALPDMAKPALSISPGPLALNHLLAAGGSGYFPLRTVRAHLAEGRLFPVPGAPEFPHAICLVHAKGNVAQGNETGLAILRESFRACLQALGED